MSEGDWLVVGLGNPGLKYEGTRHNSGYAVVDELLTRQGGRLSGHRAGAQVSEGRLCPGGPRVILAKANGFMNTSGGPVSALVNYFSITPDHLIVAHDDLDLELGRLRLKRGGGHGGHNGVRDIARALATPEFVRVRIGIGRPPGQQDVADFVLRPFAKAEREEIAVTVQEAADAVELIVDHGLIAAQQRIHGGQA